MSKNNLFVNLIEALSKEQFDSFIINFLKSVEGFDHIINTDGKNDLGMDLRVLDPSASKIQFQVTIQKTNLDNKIAEDIEKAHRNQQKYSYSNVLKFFYSKELTNEKIEELKLMAIKEHKISLEIYDAKRLAGFSENSKELQSSLFILSNLADDFPSSFFEKDPVKASIHDLLTLGKGANLRIELLKCYIVNILFEKKELDFSSICQNINEHFNQKIDEKFISNTIQKLITEKRVYKDQIKLAPFKLTEKEYSRLDISRNLLIYRERVFYKRIDEIVLKYKISLSIEKIYEAIILFFKKHYLNQSKEYLKQESELVFAKISKELLSNLGLDSSASSSIKVIDELLSSLHSNNYLQKICAIEAFTENVNLDYLENHLNNIHRDVFLDTQILLRAACYSYSPNFSGGDYFFREVKAFMKFARNQHVSLKTSLYYFKELKDQAENAYNLIPYTTLDFFKSLGTTKNVFYNFYLSLKKSGLIDLEYDEYLKDLGFDFSLDDRVVSNKIEYLLDAININISMFSKLYSINSTKDLIIKYLTFDEKHKSGFALNNDAIMLEYLSDKDTSIHQTNPIFITWDTILYKIRPQYYKDNPGCNRWFMFTPTEFIDHYSVTKLDLSNSNITNEMIAVMENRFASETYYLIDSINAILDLSNQVGVKYAKMLADIRDNQIFNQDFTPAVGMDENAIVPIDFVVHKLNTFYSQEPDIFSKYKKIFTIEENIEIVSEIINLAIEDFKRTNEISASVFSKMDKLL